MSIRMAVRKWFTNDTEEQGFHGFVDHDLTIADQAAIIESQTVIIAEQNALIAKLFSDLAKYEDEDEEDEELEYSIGEDDELIDYSL